MTIKKSRVLWGLILVFITISASGFRRGIDMKKAVERSSIEDSLVASLLRRYPQYFNSLLSNDSKYRIQIIYTQIDRGSNNIPVLTHYYYHLRPDQYFYPASTVKMPGAILALQKLNELNILGLSRESTMITESGTPEQTSVFNDSNSPDGRPTIANYIKKIFLVSDNDAYNRLYEFLGQKYLNESLHKLGYDSVQLLHRLQLSLSEEQNRTTNPIKFFDKNARLLYQQPLIKSDLIHQQRRTFLGNGYLSGDKVIEQPFDFSKKNRITLFDLHSILQSIIFPESVPARKRFRLTDDDYRFLYKYMSMKPGESKFPQYDSSYTDAYGKFLLYGGKGSFENKNIRIFNKIGDAYGFLNDIAYIVDFENGVEFMLSATIYCNSDGIFNDDKYDYETVGFPFMKHLGEVIYDYELKRTKKYKPDLSKFKIDYAN